MPKVKFHGPADRIRVDGIVLEAGAPAVEMNAELAAKFQAVPGQRVEVVSDPVPAKEPEAAKPVKAPAKKEV